MKTKVVKAITAYLNRLASGTAVSNQHAPSLLTGEPDIDACVCGRAVRIYVVDQGGAPTLRQREEIARWQRAGAITVVATEMSGVVRALEADTAVRKHLAAPRPHG